LNSFNPEKMYSVKEVSLILGWAPDTIRRFVDRGIIKPLVIPQVPGRRRRRYRSMRIPESEVKRCIRFLTRD
jgi:Helix-turn-helix domain